MKKTWIAFAMVMACASTYAQDTTAKKTETRQENSATKDCIAMKDGKMMVQKNGKWTAQKKNVTLDNGTVVSADGSVKFKTGESMTLREGQGFYMDGKMKNDN